MTKTLDGILSITALHECKEIREETSVSGISYYPRRRGVAILALVNHEKFVGTCHECGDTIEVDGPEIVKSLEILGLVEVT